LRPPASDFLLVNVDRGANRLFHALQIEMRISRDTRGHFANEPFGDVAGFCRFPSVVRDQQVEDSRVGDMLRQVGRAFEGAVRISAHHFQPAEVRALRRARLIVGANFGPRGASCSAFAVNNSFPW
jgi:hypothetical protein